MENIHLHHVFGSSLAQGYRDAVFYILESESKENKEKQKILFPTGKFLARRARESILEQKLSFTQLHENLERLCCLAVSADKREVAAVEKLRSTNCLQISLVDLHSLKHKVIKISTKADMRATSAKLLAFGPAEHSFLVLTGEPEFQLVSVKADERQATSVYSSPELKDVNQLRVKLGSNFFTISGKGLLKLLKIEDCQFRVVSDLAAKLPKGRLFYQHCWLQKQQKFILAGTDKNQIFLVNTLNGEAKQEIREVFGVNLQMVTCLRVYDKGFIAGSDMGYFAAYHYDESIDPLDDDSFGFAVYRRWACGEQRRFWVSSLDLDLRQNELLVGFKSNDIGVIDLSQFKGRVTEDGEVETKEQRDQTTVTVRLDYLYRGYHGASISSLETCLHRPLIATCSREDNTIRLWNYKHPSCQLLLMFSFKAKELSMTNEKGESPVTCLALHPSGYYMAVAFLDKVSLFYITQNSLKHYRHLMVKACSLLRFSRGGQLLALVYPKAKSTTFLISIYNSYTRELVISLQGQSAEIKDIDFSANDSVLYSCTVDGTITEWSVLTGQARTWASEFRYSSIFHYREPTQGTVILASAIDCQKNVVREIRTSPTEKDFKQKIVFLGGVRVTRMRLFVGERGQLGVLVGTSDGQLRLFGLPFEGKGDQALGLHNGAVTQLSQSSCGRFIFTGGQDGMVFVLEVGKRSGQRVEGNPNLYSVQDSLGEVVMIEKSQLEEYLKHIASLRNSVQDLKQKLLDISREEERKLEYEKSKLKAELMKEVTAWNTRYEEMKISKRTVEAENENALKKQEKAHLKAVDQLESLYQRKLAFENEKQHQLSQELITVSMRHKNELELKEEEFREQLLAQKRQFQKKFHELEAKFQLAKNYIIGIDCEYVENLEKIEGEYELATQRLRLTHKEELEHVHKSSEVLHDNMEAEKAKRKLEKQHYNELKEQNAKLGEERAAAEQNYEKIRKQLSQMEALSSERSQTIRLNKIKIRDLDSQLKDKEREVRVLKYRLTDLTKSLEPKDKQIQSLNGRLQGSQAEKKQMIQRNEELLKSNELQTTKNSVLQNNLKAQIRETHKAEERLREIVMDIHKIVMESGPKQHSADLSEDSEEEQRPVPREKEVVVVDGRRDFAKDIAMLYHKYVLNSSHVTKLVEDKRGVRETHRHIQHLENTIGNMREQMDSSVKRRKTELKKKIMENAALIMDLNAIRTENKRIFKSLQDKTKKLKQAEIELREWKEKCEALQGQRKPEENRVLKRAESAKPEVRKNKLMRGTNFGASSKNLQSVQRVMELSSELQDKEERILTRDHQLLRLLSALKEHVTIKHCEDLRLSQLARQVEMMF